MRATNVELERRKAICRECPDLGKAGISVFCRRECHKPGGAYCERWAIRQYLRRLQKPEPFCEPWKRDAKTENATSSQAAVQFTTPMDVVYPLASGRHGKKVLGSKWGNNELLYSLRSLEENFLSIGRVFIVTETLPEWLTNVVHLYAKDVHRHNKDANLIDKVLLACKSGVSQTFLQCGDDQCLLRPWDGLGVWHMGPVTGNPRGNKWWRRMARTHEYLASQGKETLFYDCHCPAPMDCKTFIQVAEAADYAPPPGMCFKTLYFNSIGIPRTKMNGRKVAFHKPAPLRMIRRQLRGKLFLGYNERGTTRAMKRFLRQRFPRPSRFEK